MRRSRKRSGGVFGRGSKQRDLRVNTPQPGRSLRCEALEDRRMLSANEFPELPRMVLVAPLEGISTDQVVFLNFDGVENVTYNGLIVVEDIDVPAFLAPSELAGQEEQIINDVVTQLGATFGGTGVIFTTEQPNAGKAYSTVFVGGNGSSFAEYGSFLGLAESVDVGNLNPSDDAFVFSDVLAYRSCTYGQYIERLLEVSSHEIGHLLGYTHDEHGENETTLSHVALNGTSNWNNETDKSIPDYNGDSDDWSGAQNYIGKPSNIPAGATVTRVDVTCRIVHPYPGDLKVWLSNDDGSREIFWDRETNDHQDIQDTFTLTSTFDGDSLDQDWGFWVKDTWPGATGDIDYARVEFYWTAPDPPPGEPGTPNLDSSDDTGSDNSDNITFQTEELTFSWSESSGVVEGYWYGWDDSTPDQHSTINTSATIDAPTTNGFHTFYVAGYNADGVGMASSLEVFIDRNRPSISDLDLRNSDDSGFSDSDNVTNDTNVRFTWTANPNDGSGIRQSWWGWSSDAINNSTTNTYADDSPPTNDGTHTFYVEVEAVSGLFGYYPDFSDELAVTWDISDPGVPTALNPDAPSTTLDKTPLLDWNDVDGAYKYYVELENSEGSNYESGWAFSSSYQVQNPLPDGDIYWRVEAFDLAGNGSGYSSRANFEVLRTGSVNASLANSSDVLVPGADTLFKLQTSPTTPLNGNPAIFTEIPEGGYWIEGWHTGSPYADEFWSTRWVDVAANQTTPAALLRDEPYAYGFRVKDGDSVVTGGAVQTGTALTYEIDVTNDSPWDRDIRAMLWVDRDSSGPFDFSATSSTLHLMSETVGTIPLGDTINELGAHDYRLEIQAMVGGQWITTDTWLWSPAVTVETAFEIDLLSVEVSQTSYDWGDDLDIRMKLENSSGVDLVDAHIESWFETPDGNFAVGEVSPSFTIPANSQYDTGFFNLWDDINAIHSGGYLPILVLKSSSGLEVQTFTVDSTDMLVPVVPIGEFPALHNLIVRSQEHFSLTNSGSDSIGNVFQELSNAGFDSISMSIKLDDGSGEWGTVSPKPGQVLFDSSLVTSSGTNPLSYDLYMEAMVASSTYDINVDPWFPTFYDQAALDDNPTWELLNDPDQQGFINASLPVVRDYESSLIGEATNSPYQMPQRFYIDHWRFTNDQHDSSNISAFVQGVAASLDSSIQLAGYMFPPSETWWSGQDYGALEPYLDVYAPMLYWQDQWANPGNDIWSEGRTLAEQTLNDIQTQVLAIDVSARVTPVVSVASNVTYTDSSAERLELYDWLRTQLSVLGALADAGVTEYDAFYHGNWMDLDSFSDAGGDRRWIDWAVYFDSLSGENHAPTDISLSPNTVPENEPTGTTVGILSTTDPDAGDTFTYDLVSGVGSSDNVWFNIVGDALTTAASFNYEAKNNYSIRVRSTDQGGLSTEKAFEIDVLDINEAPTIGSLVLDPDPVIRGQDLVLMAVDVVDPDFGDSVANVEFYRDSNNSGILEVGADDYVGQGSSSSGDWTWTGSTTKFLLGANRYFARASDGELWSGEVEAVGVVNPDVHPNADFNSDYQVSIADYTIWRNNLGAIVSPGDPGDANLDGFVDKSDYGIWKSQFGSKRFFPYEIEISDYYDYTTELIEADWASPGYFSVSLSNSPGAPVTVSVTNDDGDSNIRVQSGSNLTFNDSNWSTPQRVYVVADWDSDFSDSTAYFTVSGPGATNSPDVMFYATDQARRFDFGTATSPVAPGYVRITPESTYSPGGYGWLSGEVSGIERSVGSELTQDVNRTDSVSGPAVFAVGLPIYEYIPYYDVRVILGDLGSTSDMVRITYDYVEVDGSEYVYAIDQQEFVDEFTLETSDLAPISGGFGYLRITIEDLGGIDSYASIMGIEIQLSAGSPLSALGADVASEKGTTTPEINPGAATLATASTAPSSEVNAIHALSPALVGAAVAAEARSMPNRLTRMHRGVLAENREAVRLDEGHDDLLLLSRGHHRHVRPDIAETGKHAIGQVRHDQDGNHASQEELLDELFADGNFTLQTFRNNWRR